MPGAQGVERFVAIAIVLVPDVFAELHPEPHDAAAGRDVVGDHPVADAGIGLCGDLAQGVEVPVVVEEPVVRVKRLRMHAVGQRGGQARPLQEVSVVANPRRVDLPDPAVLADGFAIDRDVAEHDRDPAARIADFVAPALVVLDERVDLPRVAQDVPRDAHLRERDDCRPRLPCPLDESQHGGDVEVRPPRAHLHLRERDGRKVDGHDGTRYRRRWRRIRPVPVAVPRGRRRAGAVHSGLGVPWPGCERGDAANGNGPPSVRPLDGHPGAAAAAPGPTPAAVSGQSMRDTLPGPDGTLAGLK